MKYYKTIFFVSVLVLFFSGFIMAQTIIDVPPTIDGDPLNAMSKTILGDTTETGERVHPGAIYRLQRGALYLQDETMVIDFDFTLIAAEDDGTGTQPPMLIRGVTGDGKTLGYFIKLKGDSLHFKIQGLIFQGVMLDGDRKSGDRATGVRLYGDRNHMEVDNCIFNNILTQTVHVASASNAVVKLTNNIFRNNSRPDRPWGGYTASFRDNTDTLIVQNNTWFNGYGYIFSNIRNLFNYVKYDHNTIFMGGISGYWVPYLTDCDFTNNVIYGDLFLGQFQFEWEEGYWGPGGKHGIITLTKLDSARLADYGKAEIDRRVSVHNNVYGWPQEFKDWYATADSLGGLQCELWMSAGTDSMFKGLGDYNYPSFSAENNIEADPGFDADMRSAVISKCLEWAEGYRANELYVPVDTYYPQDGTSYFEIWPLPENLVYTNSTVLTHAEGGFPAGDLNWFPDKKAEWEEWVTDLENEQNNFMPKEYKLSQNYPNPFNPTTEINFSIPFSAKTSLTVFNVLGQKVATILDQKLAAGSYKYKFDASDLASGLYFYKLQSKNYLEVKKMMLIK